MLCVILGIAVGFAAIQDAARSVELHMPSSLGSDAFSDPKVTEAVLRAELSAVEGMRTSRVFILGGLSLACALTFVSALRILRPGGLPRSSVRSLLGSAALAAAVLRTLDGAQGAVIGQRMGMAMGKAMLLIEPYSKDPALYASLPAAVSVVGALIFAGLTMLVAGAFLLMSLYFRSEKVKQLLAFLDARSI